MATWLSALVYLVLIWLVAIGALIPAALLPAAMGSALIMAIKWALNLIVWLTLIQAVLSWVNPMAPLMPLLSTLTAPLLDPIRRILPRSSIDFSPLVLLVVAQIVLMVLARLSYSLMGCRSPEALRAFPRGAAADRRSRIRATRQGRQCCLEGVFSKRRRHIAPRSPAHAATLIGACGHAALRGYPGVDIDQLLAIDLVVVRHGQGRAGHQLGRHHVGRQALGQQIFPVR